MHTFTDRDGSIDMVFPTCSAVSLRTGVGSDCLINIAYNKQIPVCPSAGSKTTDKQGNRLCRSPEQLCIADPDFRFDLSTNGNNDVRGISFVSRIVLIVNILQAFIQIPFSSLVNSPSRSSLLVLDTTFSPPLPLPIRLGDTNLDGFPDLLVIAATADGHTPKLLISEPCTKGPAGCNANGQGRRGFRLLQRGAETLEATYDARGVTFIDMDEDVRRLFILCPQGNLTHRC